jgi:hypothetical protein
MQLRLEMQPGAAYPHVSPSSKERIPDTTHREFALHAAEPRSVARSKPIFSWLGAVRSPGRRSNRLRRSA